MSTPNPAAPAAAPAAPLPVDPVLSAEEEYDSAFLESIADPSVADEITPAPAKPAAVAPDAAPAPAVTPETPPEAPEEPAPASPEEPKPAATSDAVAEQLRLLREELAGEETPAPAAQPPAARPVYSEEEQNLLSAYEKDWPDIARAEELKRRKEYRELLEYAFAEVSRVYGPAIQSMQQSESDGHYNEIVTAHPDYDTIVDPVKAWVGEQSPARRAAFSTIVKEGNAEEIIDLIDLYKQAKGIAAPVAAAPSVAPAAAAVPAPVVAGTPPAAKQAAQRLSVVSSKRSATPVAADPDDFDAAFDEFAKAAK